MSLNHLQLLNFRNYTDLHIEIPLKGMVLEGDNGSGKTNFLESIYMICTARSQRGSKKSEMINFNSDFAFIEAQFLNPNAARTSRSIGFGKDKCIVMKIDNTRSDSIIDWFSNRPIISFGPNDLSLVYGTPEDRRKFMDMLCSQIFEDYLKNLLIYKKSLLNRNKLLLQKFDIKHITIYEEQMSESAAEILLKRKELIHLLQPHFLNIYSEISQNREKVNLQYQLSLKHDCSSKIEWKNVFFRVLEEHRNKDCEYGFTSIGPHRDDLSILLNNRLSKHFSSQGQCRSIVLALKLGSVFCLEKCRKQEMIFLVDDAVSELDSQRTSKFLPLIEDKGQVFIAVPELRGDVLKNYSHYHVSEGTVHLL